MPSVSVPVPNNAKLERFIAQQQGGGDGVMRGAGQEGVVTQTTPISLSVLVGAFKGFVSGRCIELLTATTTAAIVAPTGGSAGDLRRIDLVQYTYGTGVNIVTGVESSDPEAPALSADSIGLADLYLRKGMASIQTASDGTNGYVVDRRTFR